MGAVLTPYNKNFILQEVSNSYTGTVNTTLALPGDNLAGATITPISLTSKIEASMYIPRIRSSRTAGTLVERAGFAYIRNVTNSINSQIYYFGRDLAAGSTAAALSENGIFFRQVFNAGVLTPIQFRIYFGSIIATNITTSVYGTHFITLREIENG